MQRIRFDLHALWCFGAMLFVARPAYSGEVAGSIALTSDYMYRGLSQTRGAPALQGDIHYSSDHGASLGAWASSVHYNDTYGTQAEIDVYAGLRRALPKDFELRTAVAYYIYPWNINNRSYNFVELSSSLTFRDTVSATVSWAPNVTRYAGLGNVATGKTWAYDLASSWPLYESAAGVSITWDLGVGYFDLNDLASSGYWHWGSSVAVNAGKWLGHVSYVDTDSTAVRLFSSGAAGQRWAVTFLRRF
jgi:uncharacterized protein (TIGR02001 family)